jgi:hypothetical protein
MINFWAVSQGFSFSLRVFAPLRETLNRVSSAVKKVERCQLRVESQIFQS